MVYVFSNTLLKPITNYQKVLSFTYLLVPLLPFAHVVTTFPSSLSTTVASFLLYFVVPPDCSTTSSGFSTASSIASLDTPAPPSHSNACSVSCFVHPLILPLTGNPSELTSPSSVSDPPVPLLLSASSHFFCAFFTSSFVVR